VTVIIISEDDDRDRVIVTRQSVTLGHKDRNENQNENESVNSILVEIDVIALLFFTITMKMMLSSLIPRSAPPAHPLARKALRYFTSSSEKQILLEHVHDKNNLSNDVFISVVTLNRPKANAMNQQLLQEFSDLTNTLQESASRCVVLTSHSTRVFSAGADLKERSTMTIEQAADFVTLLRNAMQQWSCLPMPTIAAIEGVAVGGGLELALACDLRIASKTAVLGLPETSLAIVPGAGGTQRLPRLIGTAKAKELIFTGNRVDGVAAKELGLVQRVVDPGTCLDEALDLAWKIAGNGPIAIRAAKQSIDQGTIEALTMEDALEIERLNYAKVLPTEDRLEGLAAFKEGRTPEYKGR
jgi:enoyl-CoA hydratase/carnithine racemase